MRTASVVLVLIALILLTSPVSAQHAVHSVSVNLAPDNGTTILYLNPLSGTVTGIACKVTSAVTTSGLGPWWTIEYSVDGGNWQILPYIYYGAATFSQAAAGHINAFSSGAGNAVNDSFVLPVNIPFSSSIWVRSVSVYNAGSGTLVCSTVRK